MVLILTLCVVPMACGDGGGSGEATSGDGPTTSLSTTASSYTNVSPIDISIAFNDDVTDFDLADIRVLNGTVVSFSGGPRVYDAAISPSTDGPVQIDVASGSAFDIAGNPSKAAATLVVMYDTAAPSVIIATSSPGATSLSPFAITISFDEPVSGLADTDVRVQGGVVDGFFSLSSTEYAADIVPSATGPVQVDVPSGVVFDAAGNPNDAAPPLLVF